MKSQSAVSGKQNSVGPESEAVKSRERQKEAEGQTAPGSDLFVWTFRVSLSPQADTRGGCPASCRAECACEPLERGQGAVGSVPRPNPHGCCHCSSACQELRQWLWEVGICLLGTGVSLFQSDRAVTPTREQEKATKQLKILTNYKGNGM